MLMLLLFIAVAVNGGLYLGTIAYSAYKAGSYKGCGVAVNTICKVATRRPIICL